MTVYRSSASQISTAELCLRKWGFLKLDKIPAPPNRYASFGSITHTICEAWFRHCTPPPETPEGRTARLIVRELPPPQTPGIEVEQEIRLELGGVPFKGYVDFRMLAGHFNFHPFVSDHKTCGNFSYALSPETMHEDIQATIYAASTGAPAVDLQWTYGQRNGKKVLPVLATVTAEQIAPRLERTAETAKLLRDVTAEHPPAIELPFDAGGCEAFGKCPFQDLCNLSASKRIQSIMAQSTQQKEWKERLAARKAARENGTPSPHPSPAAEAMSPAAVNPPDAPPPAEPTPASPAEPSAPARRGRPRKTAEQKAADKAAKAAEPAELRGAPAPKGVTPAQVAEAIKPETKTQKITTPITGIVELLCAKYREGLLDGFKLGRDA